MDTQITDFDSRLNKLEKAYADNYAATGKFPVSQQVEYTPEIKSKVGEMAPFYRFLESKGCIQGTDSSYVGFYVESNTNTAAFMDELDEIPDHGPATYTEVTKKMSTVATGIEVSMMAQMGNNTLDYLSKQIENGYVNITNILDKTLLEGLGTTASKDFKGFANEVTTNVKDNSTNKITENIINDMIEDIVDDNKGTPDAIITNYTVARQLRDIIYDYYRFNDKVDVGIGFRVNTFEAENGQQLPIIIDPNMTSNQMFIVDSSTIQLKQLMAPTLFTDLPTNILGYRQAIATFITSQNIAEFQNGLIKNIGTTTPSG
jgi:hypothetical protein